MFFLEIIFPQSRAHYFSRRLGSNNIAYGLQGKTILAVTVISVKREGFHTSHYILIPSVMCNLTFCLAEIPIIRCKRNILNFYGAFPPNFSNCSFYGCHGYVKNNKEGGRARDLLFCANERWCEMSAALPRGEGGTAALQLGLQVCGK